MDYSMRINQRDLEFEVRGNDQCRVTTVFGIAYALSQWPLHRVVAMATVTDALGKALEKHPDFPEEPSEAAAIIAEEFLELVRTVNDHDTFGRCIEEASHTAATCLRFIESMVPHEV